MTTITVAIMVYVVCLIDYQLFAIFNDWVKLIILFFHLFLEMMGCFLPITLLVTVITLLLEVLGITLPINHFTLIYYLTMVGCH